MQASDEQKEVVLAYLGQHNVMTLATSGSDGVWAAALFYVHNGLNLTFLSAEHTRHARHLASNPHVAATIQDQLDDWTQIQGIQLAGIVSRLGQQDREQAITDYCLKYQYVATDPRLQVALSKVQWYQLTPTRLYWIDNRGGLGNRIVIQDLPTNN